MYIEVTKCPWLATPSRENMVISSELSFMQNTTKLKRVTTTLWDAWGDTSSRPPVQHTFNTFVGGELLGPTFLGPPTVRTVGVGVTFSLLLWTFCWTYRFRLPNSRNCWPLRTVVETFDSFVGATFLTSVGPTVLGPYYCWGDFSPFVGPTISGPEDCWGAKICRSNKIPTTKERK